MSQEKSVKKKSNLVRNFIFLLIGIVLVNFIAYKWKAQVDLTSDKRYTTTKGTQQLIKNLEAPIKLSLFLSGEDVPAAFQRLAKSTQEVALNFKSLSKGKIEVWSLDPTGDDSTAFQTVMEFGMEGVPVTIDAGKQGTKQKMVYPWVLVENMETGAAMPVFIQETNVPQLSRTILNKSEMLLEYNIANAIHQVAKKERAKIGFLTGNHQDLGYNVMSALANLSNYYILDTVNLQMTTTIPTSYNTIIVSSPYKAFDELDKFKLDQYLMHGGNVVYLLNQATGSLDSFKQDGKYNVLPIDLNLGDLLFQYGVRVNSDLVKDGSNFERIPLSKSGKREESMLFPWVYFPVLTGNSDHPITKNLEGILGRFVSSMDLVDQEGDVQKTVLLQTSRYAKKVSLPAPLQLTDAVLEFNINDFNTPHIPIAVLLEGTFQSHYGQRLPPEVNNFVQANKLQVLKQSNAKGKLIVASDGDLLYNDLGPNGPLDLGQYIYGGFRYDNKSFLLNAIEYLSNPNHLLEARSKSFTNRILDPKRVQSEKGMWQLINIGVPSIIIILLGGIWTFVRRKKYA